LKTRLDETTALFEQGQRDLRNKQNEIQRLTHELDKTREQKDQLTRENKKLAGKYNSYNIFHENQFCNNNFNLDDLHDAKNTISEYNRRLHELELELRRLENERDELSAAYKEAEAVYIHIILLFIDLIL
jgi:chromosome segregation ATPase